MHIFKGIDPILVKKTAPIKFQNIPTVKNVKLMARRKSIPKVLIKSIVTSNPVPEEIEPFKIPIKKIRFLIFIFLIGILNGSISSGTGLLVTILLIKTLGMDFLRAISLTFLTVGIFWNFTGAIFLSKIRSVPPNLLIILIIGSFVGGYFGAHLSKLKGNIVIKKSFTTVCLLVGISLLTKSIKTFYIN